MKKFVIYDFDGTLADTLHAHLNAYRYAFSKFDKFINAEDIIKHCFNKSDKEAASHFDVDLEEFSKHYQQGQFLEFKHLHAYPYVPKTLGDLRDKGYKIAVGSMQRHEILVKLLDQLDLTKYMDQILGFSKNAKKKTEIFRNIMDDLGAEPADCVIVGDADSDLIAGKELGIDCILYYPDGNRDFYDLEYLKSFPNIGVISLHEQVLKIL